MKPLSLPENFTLPSGSDIERLVSGIDDEAQRQGGIRRLLGHYRVDRKHSDGFSTNVLSPLSKIALELELTDSDGAILDKNHSLANAAFSGMLFGDIVNTIIYPELHTTYVPYRYIFINPKYLRPSEITKYIELGQNKTGAGRRYSHYAMAALQLDHLTSDTLIKVNDWSSRLIPSETNHEAFVKGFGMTLYAAWDTYTDQFDKEGRPYESLVPPYYSITNRGDDTSQ